MLIDTHAHLNFVAYKEDLDDVIKRSLENGVWMINIGSQYTTSRRAVDIAEKYPEGVYAAVGLHPIHAADGFDQEKYKELTKSPKVVAIGEIGLDYKSEYSSLTRERQGRAKRGDESTTSSTKEKQKEVLFEQLNLAKELDMPVIFHCRMAHDELISYLREYDYPGLKGVIHCFTGNREQTRKYLEMGFFLGFNGIIFKMDLEKVVTETPLEKILVETDCPYLTPPWGEGRNEPIYIKHIVEKIAKIKNLSYEEIAEITTQNARDFFKI